LTPKTVSSLWKLPVLFVCENNLYAMGTRIDRAQSVTDLASKACGYSLASAPVDGMDVLAVEAAAKKAADYVRGGEGPYFLECRTYRFRAHSMFDAELYRTKEEVEQWKKRDPIGLFTGRLKDEGLLSDADMETLEREAAGAVDRSVAFAEAGTWEPVEGLTRFVYTERKS
jgi:pyruvate dehydrogenase E1 component alpha subunit